MSSALIALEFPVKSMVSGARLSALAAGNLSYVAIGELNSPDVRVSGGTEEVVGAGSGKVAVGDSTDFWASIAPRPEPPTGAGAGAGS